MNFRTEIKISKSEFDINYNSKIFFIGSCFTDNIGNYFKKLKFDTLINPYGVLYNPESIYNTINFIIENKKFKESDLLKFNDKWISLNHHGSFSDTQLNKILNKINTENTKAHIFLKQTDFLFITFGTSWIFRYNETKKTVANCHKIPAKKFTREILSVNNIINNYNKLITNVTKFNPKIKIIFTVSPIRHLKDGAHQNQISKSTLFLAINELNKKFNNTSYFPSYEIVNDDLRDYRFYKDDLTHLTDFTINYIWEKISEKYLKKDTINKISEIDKIIKAVNHKPYNKDSDEYKKFIIDTLKKINKFEENLKLDFSTERNILNIKI